MNGTLSTAEDAGEEVCKVTDCTATNGGAVYVNGSSSTLNLNGTVYGFSANNGGGVYVNSGTMNLYGSIEGGNAIEKTTDKGGGVYVNNGTLNMLLTEENPEASPSIKNCTAPLGGAIFETGSSASVMISVGEISGNTATGYGGGALRMENNARAEISGTALIQNNKVEAAGEKYGGAVNIKAGTLKISGGTISGNRALSTNNKEARGGAINVDGADSSVEITGGTITGNAAGYTEGTNTTTDAYGGAVAARNGAKVIIADGTDTYPTITGNTVCGTRNSRGAGIYIDYIDEKVSTLELSGAPNFGGTGTESKDGSDATAEISGPNNPNTDQPPTNGNYTSVELPKAKGASHATNGLKDYDTARQDIYIAGYASTNDDDRSAASLVITGDITSGDGTIWVWAAESPRYRALRQFAKYGEGVSDTETTLKAFRNARADIDTGADLLGTYLFGVTKEEDTENVFWNGIDGFDFVFRKIDGDGEALSGATFALYMATEDGTDIRTDDSIAGEDKRVAYQVSQSDGTKVNKTATSGGGTTKDPWAGTGAEYPVSVNVLDSDGTTLISRDVYDVDKGIVVFDTIPPGIYFMKETVFPKEEKTGKDYLPAEELYRVVMNNDGTYSIHVANRDATGRPVWTACTTSSDNVVSWPENTKDAPSDTLSFGSGEDAYTVDVALIMNVPPLKRKVILRKVNGENVPLSGAQFRLFRADGSEVTEGQNATDNMGNPCYESGESGVYFIGTLPCGKYTLREIQAPTGYEQAGDIVFYVTENGVESMTGSPSTLQPAKRLNE